MKRRSLLLPRFASAALSVASVALLLLSSCANKECYENQNTLPLAGFLGADSHREFSMRLLTVYGIGAPNDSLLADSASMNEIYLPFRPYVPESRFVFRYGTPDAPEPDTITFRYSTKPWFASEACGVVYYFNIDSISYTRNLIDSIAVPGMLITNANRRFIEIYLREEETGL